MLHRRSFLRGLISAPAVVAIGSLMPVRGLIMPVEGKHYLEIPDPFVGYNRLTQVMQELHELYGDGITDDTIAVQAMIDGSPVIYHGRTLLPREDGKIYFPSGSYRVSKTLRF